MFVDSGHRMKEKKTIRQMTLETFQTCGRRYESAENKFMSIKEKGACGTNPLVREEHLHRDTRVSVVLTYLIGRVWETVQR